MKGERIASRFRASAHAGEPAAFGRRVFGWDDLTGQVLRDDEAALLREAAGRVIRGETCTAIARDFQARGVIGAHGVLSPSRRLVFWRT